jgi:solute carrier family 35, member E3
MQNAARQRPQLQLQQQQRARAEEEEEEEDLINKDRRSSVLRAKNFLQKSAAAPFVSFFKRERFLSFFREERMASANKMIGINNDSQSQIDTGVTNSNAQSAAQKDLSVFAALALSVVSSVSIVIVNKYLISTLGFQYVTFLTAMHMIVTAVALRFAAKYNFVEPKEIERVALIRFSFINGISIAFLNLSLGFNSVGFYQMTKLAIIPCTVAMHTVYYGKKYSSAIKGALGILLLGVGIATVTDMQLNGLGTFMSVCAVLTTCVSQIWTNHYTKQFSVSSTQLLYAASPYMAAILATIALPLDSQLVGGTPFDVTWSVPVLFWASLSCAIAISVNFSTFLVIGKCDAVTYQVLGHLKTMLVLGFGFTVIGNPATGRNLMGIAVALVGMVVYAQVESKEKQIASRASNSEKELAGPGATHVLGARSSNV